MLGKSKLIERKMLTAINTDTVHTNGQHRTAGREDSQAGRNADNEIVKQATGRNSHLAINNTAMRVNSRQKESIEVTKGRRYE